MGHIYLFKFFFIIPAAGQNVRNPEPPICSILSPALQVAKSVRDYQPQVSIKDQILASISYETDDFQISSRPLVISTTREINFLPYDDERPLVALVDYPQEFVTHVPLSFKRFRFGRNQGILHVRMIEPSPLTYESATRMPQRTISSIYPLMFHLLMNKC